VGLPPLRVAGFGALPGVSVRRPAHEGDPHAEGETMTTPTTPTTPTDRSKAQPVVLEQIERLREEIEPREQALRVLLATIPNVDGLSPANASRVRVARVALMAAREYIQRCRVALGEALAALQNGV
jgi:hypothetical protein